MDTDGPADDPRRVCVEFRRRTGDVRVPLKICYKFMHASVLRADADLPREYEKGLKLLFINSHPDFTSVVRGTLFFRTSVESACFDYHGVNDDGDGDDGVNRQLSPSNRGAVQRLMILYAKLCVR